MEITILGYIFIPIGILMLAGKREYLLFAAVLTCGMTGSSVLQIGDTALQPSYYFALLWILSKALSKRWNHKIFVNRTNLYLIMFVMVSTVSLIMPWILEGKTTVLTIDNEIKLLSFSSANITQLMYLIFCAAFCMLLYYDLKEDQSMQRNVFRCYIVSVVLVCVILVYQQIAYRFDFPFDVIFRMGLHGEKTERIFWDTRVSGPCLEASMLSCYLVGALPVVVRSSSKFVKYCITFSIFVFGLLSFSSTFLVGAAVWAVLEIVLRVKSLNLKLGKQTLMVLICACVAGVLFITAEDKWDDIIRLLVRTIEEFTDKIALKNVSGQERSETFVLLIRAWLASPILGVGFGSSRGKDLFSTWLANTGIIGMAMIILYLKRIIFNKNNRRDVRLSVFLVWMCMFISVPEPYYLYIWILIVLSMTMQKDQCAFEGIIE